MAKPFYPPTKREFYLEIMEAYRKHIGRDTFDPADAVKWAFDNGKLKADPVDPVKEYTKRFAEALRQEMMHDPQHRKVRKWHANKHFEEDAEGIKQQKVLWFPIDKATQGQMELSVQQRRHQIIGDCFQLKQDADSFNENWGDKERPIEPYLDFTNDVAEREQSATYGDDPNDSDDDDDQRV